MKAISSQNECGSTIGLALISIHLACLCAETAGATAGGWGGTEGGGGEWLELRVLCMCVDDPRDRVKHRTDGGTVSTETTCGESLTDFMFSLVLDNVIMCNLSKKRVIV